MILTFSIKNCFRNFKIQGHFKLKNTSAVYHNQSNLFRFRSASYSTEIDVRYKISDINSKILTEIVSSIEKREISSNISSEIEYLIAKNRQFPDYITADQLKLLCDFETRSQRVGYLAYLFKKERHKMNDAKKKLEKLKERISRKPQPVYDVKNRLLEYGLGRNTALITVRTHTIKNFYKYRLANATLFGPKIVLDLSYDPLMGLKEKSACVTQLALVYSANRKNPYPYDLHFCNAMPSYMTVKKFQEKILPQSTESFVTLTENNYLDIFPKEKLVYLSPHAKETLKEYDHSAVYVIGAFVDTVKKQLISANKAESEEIKSYSLPLDDYVMWGAGTKSLTVNQVFEIMLIMKNTGDWKKAFQVIPTRKIRRLEKEQIENQNVPDKIFLANTS